MKKLLPILFVPVLVVPAFSADDVELTLAARRTCTEIKADIDALSAQKKLPKEEQEKLNRFRLEYRRKCVARAGSRRTNSGYLYQAELEDEEETDTDNSENADVKTDETTENVETTETADATTEEVVPEKTEEEIIAEIEANLAAGLCPDGEKPNRFGCCANETFRDMGKLGFNCCPNDGGDCYPPVK